MATITHDDLWFCDDCTIVVVNGDYSGLDYHYGSKADERMAEIDAGQARLAELGYPVIDSDEHNGRDEFSTRRCDCCNTRLAGARSRFAILSK